MPSSHVHLAFVALAAALCTNSCGTEAKPAETSQKLKIYYFWTTAGDPNQHSSIRTGVEKSKLSKHIQELEKGPVEITGIQDPDTVEEAIAKAHELRRSPDTLAVIGHTYSGTTWSTLPVYAEAGIPVIVTNATSPYLFHEHGERDEPNIDFAKLNANPAGPRFTNAFRLIASDTPDQASAIQLTIRKLQSDDARPGVPQEPARVMLICDETSHYNTKVYSKPMCDYLEHETTHRDLARERPPDYTIIGSRTIDLDHADLWGLITEIHATDPQYIVLIGYNELALDVIQGLTERAAPSSYPARYKFIMTDAALGSRLRFPSKLHIYITSPARPHENANCNSSEPGEGTQPDPATSGTSTRKNDGIVARKKALAAPETAEAFAYDAVMILAESVAICQGKNHLDRSCVLEDLRGRQGGLRGNCEFYDLHEGELQNANYYVYSNERDHKSGEPSSYPKWCARSQDETLKPFGAACKEPHQSVVGEQHH